MRIEKAKNENVKCFENLAIGEAFYPFNHFSTDLYIKTYGFECEEAWENLDDDNAYNAIKLSDGKPYWFTHYDKVVIPNCKIVVE